MLSTRTVGIFQVMAAGIGFGFLGIFGKLAFASGIEVGELLVWRFTLAATLMWLSLAIARRESIRIARQQVLICAALGIFGYAIFSTLYFVSIQGVSASLAALLLYTFPVLVTLGGRFFLGEPMSARQWAALPAASAGLALLFWGEIDVRSWSTVIAGLASAVCYAAYVLASRRWQGQISPLTSGLYVMSFAAIGLALFHQPSLARLREFDFNQLSLIVALATLSTIAPLIFFLGGLQKLKSTEASILCMIEPMTAAALSALIFGERFSLTQLGGAIGILVGLILTLTSRTGSQPCCDPAAK